ncbi:aromatic-ring-hydroxylating dioxygenase subunit beta [Cupriavidus necator]|uniref:aromatic-ring-hydroxylating dioxygenase subunit beta n=1 Tax=Cupriavidus necator TaxID=106590 RepID=UPI0039C15592
MNKANELSHVAPSLQLAQEFIWREAELLDRKDYHQWAALWTDSGHYVVPIDPDTTDFAATLNYTYDDARMRAMRIERLTSGHSVSAVDAARTVRTVSRFTEVSSTGDLIEVNSAQILVAYKREVHTLFAADLTHRLRFTQAGIRLEQKVIRLINATDSLNALGFLL